MRRCNTKQSGCDHCEKCEHQRCEGVNTLKFENGNLIDRICMISSSGKLTERDLDMFGAVLDFGVVSRTQKIPERHILKHLTEMNFVHVSQYQKLNDDIIQMAGHLLDKDRVKYNNHYLTKNDILGFLELNLTEFEFEVINNKFKNERWKKISLNDLIGELPNSMLDEIYEDLIGFIEEKY